MGVAPYSLQRLSRNIRHVMTLRDLDSCELRRLAGIDPRTMDHAIDGQPITKETKTAIAKALGVPVEMLEWWEPERINRALFRLPRRKSWIGLFRVRSLSKAFPGCERLFVRGEARKWLREALDGFAAALRGKSGKKRREP